MENKVSIQQTTRMGCCDLHIIPSKTPITTMIQSGVKTVDNDMVPLANRRYMRISKIKMPVDIKPVLTPNLSERCNRGKYSVRSRWSLESARCRLSLASPMNTDKALADWTWHQKRPTCDSHEGNRMNQYGKIGINSVHRAVANKTVQANPTETTNYNMACA